MKVGLNKSTLTVALVVIITLLVVNLAVSAVPQIAGFKKYLGLS